MAYFDPKLQLVLNGTVISGWTTANPNTEVVFDSGATVATIDSLSIRGGRQDVTVQPSAMQCSIDVVTSGSVPDTYSQIGATMVVNVYNPVTSAWVPLFTGLLSDKTVRTDSWSDGAGLYRYTFSGYSRLASFQLESRSYAGSSNVTSSTGSASDRINEVFGGWQYSGSWIGGLNTDSILLHKRDNGTYLSADIIESAATSAKGCVHDRADGLVYYNNYAQTLQTTNGTIESAHIIGNGLSSIRSITDIYTVCVVTSTNASVSDQQDSSTGGQISAYGKRYGYRTTELQSQSVMAAQATAFLTARQNPRWNPEAITVDLGLIDTTTYGTWLAKYFGVRTNSRFTVPLPSALGGNIDALLDNWNWRFSRGRMFLEMQLSNALYTHDSSEL
jgi:hypothetical protein